MTAVTVAGLAAAQAAVAMLGRDDQALRHGRRLDLFLESLIQRFRVVPSIRRGTDIQGTTDVAGPDVVLHGRHEPPLAPALLPGD